MTRKQVHKILDRCLLPDSCNRPEFIETHISWILLTDRYAFKIKRPVKFSFLDFSTLSKRRHYCEQELELNRRFAPEMYLAVLPVTASPEIVDTEDQSDEVIDYAVQMKRLDQEKRMDILLNSGNVSDGDLTRLAETVAAFHGNAKIIGDPFDTPGFQERFSDLLSVSDFIGEHLGEERLKKVRECIAKSNVYLSRNRDFFNERSITGKRRDVHGDLKTSNIFLADDPVLFDCIEFSDEDRQIDVLNDIAFLCVDIDVICGLREGRHVYEKYLEASGTRATGKAHKLFLYYKSYRANIRAKLVALKSKGNPSEEREIREMGAWLDHMELNMDALV